MKLITFAFVLSLIVCIFGNINEAIGENYFCSSANYTGDFDPDFKGGEESCEHLKDFSLPYSVCLQSLALTENAYKLGQEAYNNGNCVPYQIRTMKVGTASCSAKFIAEKNFASLQIETQFGKSEDRQACYNKLEKTLKEEFPDLNQLER